MLERQPEFKWASRNQLTVLPITGPCDEHLILGIGHAVEELASVIVYAKISCPGGAPSMASKCVPLKDTVKYCVMDPPSGAPGLILIAIRCIEELEPSIAIETRLGHSYWRPRRP